MTDTLAKLTEADAGKVAFERFIAPALAVLRAEYLCKMAALGVQPMEGRPLAGIQALAHALRVTDEVEKQMRVLIAEGVVAKSQHEFSDNIARMNPEARKWATY